LALEVYFPHGEGVPGVMLGVNIAFSIKNVYPAGDKQCTQHGMKRMGQRKMS